MKHGFYTQLREKLARVSAVIDAKILHRQPKYLGPSVMIGPFSEHGCPAKNNAYLRTSKMKKACYIDDRIPLWSIHAL